MGSEEESVRRDVPPSLDELFAVVLWSRLGGKRVRWDTSRKEWLCSSDWGIGFRRQEPRHRIGDGEWSMWSQVHDPEEADIERVVALADGLVRDRICQWCGHAELRLHGVAPDVYGRPSLVCVLRPDPTCVSSYGGGGRAKHWGSRSGCQSVRGGAVHAPHDWALRAGYMLYGEPLDALDVFDRDWCSKCSGTAWNVWNHAERSLREKHGRDAEELEIRRWIEKRERRDAEGEWLGVVIHEMGDRTPTQLRAALRASWNAEDHDEE
jgi:hypothetical protein